jgi:hypothetical protein
MTQRHVLTVDFKDIKALEVTCSLCGTKLTIPVPTEARPGNVECVGCNKRLWDGPEDKESRFVSGFLVMLSQAQKRDDKVFHVGFSLDGPETVKGTTSET